MPRQRYDEDPEAFAAGPGVQRLAAADLAQVMTVDRGRPHRVQDLFSRFEQEGIPAWVVGGAPRDWLEGRISGDLDVAAATGFGRLKRVVGRVLEAGAVVEEYADFGLLRWNCRLGEIDFNILRSLPEPGAGRSMFEQRNQPTDRLSEDALLRDFTLNAIYFCPATGLFLDPTRRGLAALREQRLEFAGPSYLANTNGFLSLRTVKFLARGYRASEEVERFLFMHLDEDLVAMGPERVSAWLRRQVPARIGDAFGRIAKAYGTGTEARRILEGAVRALK